MLCPYGVPLAPQIRNSHPMSGSTPDYADRDVSKYRFCFSARYLLAAHPYGLGGRLYMTLEGGFRRQYSKAAFL